MARERIERARALLRSLRGDSAPAEPPVEVESDPAPAEPEPPPSAPVEAPEASALGRSPSIEPPGAGGDDETAALAPAWPSELADGDRRESVAQRLLALRARAPQRPKLRRPEGYVPPPAPRRAGSGVGARLTSAGHGVAGGLAGAGGRISEGWGGIPLIARQRLGAAVIVLAVAAILAFVLVPAAPCSFPGGDECAPADDAIDLVPDDALAYAHLDIDPESDQFAAAKALAARVPLLSGMLAGPISKVDGQTVDFGAQVAPWAGGEAALALLPGAGRPERVTLIEADDSGGARDFAAGLLGRAASTEDVDGIEVTVGARDQAAALLDGFLVLGGLDAVTRIVDPPDDAGKLETSEAADAIDELPDDRVAYAYLSGAGARAVLSDPSLEPVDTFVDSAGSAGVVAALSVDGDVASLTVRSTLDPARADESPGFFSALPEFSPSLDADVGAGALAYLGLGEPASSVERLLSQAASRSPGLSRAYEKAAKDLRKGGISIRRDLLPLLGSEVALSVEPVAAASATPGVVGTPGVPYVSLLASGVDSRAAAADLAELQKPLADALVPESGEAAGQVAAFETLQIAGIEAQSLTVSPNVKLTYATYDDRLAVATDPLGIAQARAGGDGLVDSDTFREVTAGIPEEVSLIAYLDLRDLISLGEQVGLAADPGYATLAPDLRALDAAAVSVDDEDGMIRTDLRLAIGDTQQAGEDAPVPGGE